MMKGDTLMSSFLSKDFPKDKLSQPRYRVKVEKDVAVKMRDGVTVAVDIFRPDAPGKFPTLYASSPYQKNLVYLPSVPAFHERETNQIEWFVERGYVYVHADIRGSGVSEGMWRFHSIEEQRDHYDLIEWMAQQEWCTGKVGMIGESYYAWVQWFAAAMQPPHLATIVPFDGGADMYRDVVFHGGLLNMSFVTWWHFNMRAQRLMDIPGPFPQDPLKPDTMKWDMVYEVLRHPLYDDFWKERTPDFKKIRCPVYSIGIWHKAALHLRGNIVGFEEIEAPKKRLLFTGPAHLERPFHTLHDDIIRWYDHWLKGVDNGVEKDPPVKTWVMGENKWRTWKDWPVPETQWTKFYLDSWERLTTVEQLPLDKTQSYNPDPDVFTQMPLKKTMKVERLRYMTEPLPDDLLMVGPCVLKIFAALDQDDTNWIVALSDVGPDVSVRTQREGERDIPEGLPERELTRGWLKASLRELDPKMSKPWAPFHKLTREAQKPVVPGKIDEYQIELLSTANMFLRGHRICVDIMSLDVPTGTAGLSNVEFIGNHVCSSKTVTHSVYHNAEYPSHLLLPVIPLK